MLNPVWRACVLALFIAGTLACAVPGAQSAEGDLTFSTFVKGGFNDLNGFFIPIGIDVSADGRNVYVASNGGDAVVEFTRDPTTGELTPMGSQRDGIADADGLGGAVDVVSSHDGRSVYVASQGDDALAVFRRDPSTGDLSFVEREHQTNGGTNGLKGAESVVVSPDGRNVYVASKDDGGVVSFTRDPVTSALDFIDSHTELDFNLRGADGVTISPDGNFVYVASDESESLTAFSRDATTGKLTFVESEKDGANRADGLKGANEVTISPDGRFVYVDGESESAISIFRRDLTTGEMGFVGLVRHVAGDLDGLGRVVGIDVSPDGKNLYSAAFGENAVATYGRDPGDGSLRFEALKMNGVDGVNGLLNAVDVAVSPDGRNVYATGFQDNAIVTFAREADVTAPETEIGSGPAGETTQVDPSFGFSSDDPKFTAGFECSLDGSGFQNCASPFSRGNLDLGAHRLEVRATDTAGNADPSPAVRSFSVVAPDTEVLNPVVKAAKVQKAGRKVRVKVRAGAGEQVALVGTGTITGRFNGDRMKVRLEAVSASAQPDQIALLTLKPASRKGSRKALKLLRRHVVLRSPLSVRITDSVGNTTVRKRLVRLTKKG